VYNDKAVLRRECCATLLLFGKEEGEEINQEVLVMRGGKSLENSEGHGVWGGNAELDELLLEHGMVWLNGEINIQSAADFIKRLHLLEQRYISGGRPQGMRALCYIMSCGGGVNETLGIIDVVRSLSLPVAALGVGLVASAAVWVLAAFPKGCRYAYENTRFLLHEGFLGIEGKASDARAHIRENQRVGKILIKALADSTGKEMEKFKPLVSSKEYYFGAVQAKKLGIIDEIIQTD